MTVFKDTRCLQSVVSEKCHKDSWTPWEAVYAFRQGRKLVRPTFQGRVYNFLERPKGWKALTYHGAIFLATVGSLFLSVVAAVAENKLRYNEALFFVEVIFVICLSIEYIARVWSAGCRSKYMGLWGRLKFIFKLVCFIDLAVTLSSILVIIFGSEDYRYGPTAITGVRFLQILRVLRLDRECACWRLLASVIKEHYQEMKTALYIGFLGLVFSSYFMFLLERDVIMAEANSAQFETYADSLWWGVVTMMTIGYGDKVPQTWNGRLIACISALFTVSFFALPAGILGSGFALKVQQQQRQKHFSRQIPAAANLIQTLWRCYAADKHSNSIATWKIHLRSPTHTAIKYNKTMAALRRRKPKYKGDGDKSEQNNYNSYGEIAVNLEVPKLGLHQSRSVPDMMISIHNELMKNDGNSSNVKLHTVFNVPDEYRNETVFDDNESLESQGVTQLSEVHKNAIRAIRKIKYFVAKRKFQQARKPYDVGDVIEQYSQGQIGMNVRLKELHRRLDQMLGKPGVQILDKNGKQVTLIEKLHQMDQQMQSLDKKIDSISCAVQTIVRELQKSRSDKISMAIS